MPFIYLTRDQEKQVNDIYTRIVNKYINFSSDGVHISGAPIMTPDDAAALAEIELGARRTKILDNYADRVAQINENASKRGMAHSSIVLQQLDNALLKKQDELGRLENAGQKLAKKILSDNQKLLIATEREKAASKSRSLRDFVAVSKMRLTVPYNAQNLIDSELYSAYLAWLLQFPSMDAVEILLTNPVFMLNMGNTKYQQLVTELRYRAGA